MTGDERHVADEVLREIEARSGVEVRGLPLAYEGKDGCEDPTCRCAFTPPDLFRCIGWHCGVCDLPSSMYGHTACRADTREGDEVE